MRSNPTTKSGYISILEDQIRGFELKQLGLKTWLKAYFEELRFDEKFHIGLGDIRLTPAMQKMILNKLES